MDKMRSRVDKRSLFKLQSFIQNCHDPARLRRAFTAEAQRRGGIINKYSLRLCASAVKAARSAAWQITQFIALWKINNAGAYGGYPKDNWTRKD